MQTRLISAIIIDNDAQSVEELCSLLNKHPGIKLNATFPSADEAFDFLTTNAIDLIFVDVEISGLSGLDFALELKKYDLNTRVIFTTKFPDHAIDAIKVSAFDYLLKPIKEAEFRETIRRYNFEKAEYNKRKENIETNMSRRNHTRFRIRGHNGLEMFHTEEVTYIEADGNRSKVYLNDGSMKIVHMQLGSIESLISGSPHEFCRISRKHLVNMAKATAFNRQNKDLIILTSTGEKTLMVSESRLSSVENEIKK